MEEKKFELLDVNDWIYVIPASVLEYKTIPILEEGKDFVGHVCEEICSIMMDYIITTINRNEQFKGIILNYNISKRSMTLKYETTDLGTIDIYTYLDKEDKEVTFEIDLRINSTEYSVKASCCTSNIEEVLTMMTENLMVNHSKTLSKVIISELSYRLGFEKFSGNSLDTIKYNPTGKKRNNYTVLKIINANEKSICFKYMGKEITNRLNDGYTLKSSIHTMANICTSHPTELIDLMIAISDALPYCYVMNTDDNDLPIIQKRGGEVIARIEQEGIVLLGKRLSMFANNTIEILKLLSTITIK